MTLRALFATFASFAALTAMVAAAPSSPIDSLHWLSGRWQQVEGDAEEIWLAPKGGVMLGLHRDIGSRGAAFFEFLRIQNEGERVVYYASPMGREPTPFELSDVSDGRVVFDNPEHDFPQRIIYRLEGDELIARIEGTENGKERSSEWRWRRAR